MEYLIIIAILLFAIINYFRSGEKFYKFISDSSNRLYDKYAPYSFKHIRKKIKDMGMDLSPKEYLIQYLIFVGGAFIISYLYFYNIIVSIIYSILVIAIVPYLSYLRCKRIYSEFIFEQIQTYTTNTIMEFQITQSFVKALEGVYSSGVLEDPVKSDVKYMIDLAYQNGDIKESIEYMNSKYDYYMTRNMHQLFLQITKEGSRDSSDVLGNMLLDIDQLVEAVYSDRMDRKTFHGKFILFGVALYFMVILIQLLLTVDTYIQILDNIFVYIALHILLIVNTYFLLKGEKYYNENVGAE
ncbi:MAG: hypothetical protein PUD59_00095 [bacterium]|nr:hypothetical protein [bacterium]